MSEEPEVHIPPAKPKATKRRKRRPAATKLDIAAVEFEGLSAVNCCDGCREGHCIITESRFCGHPYKASHASASVAVQERIDRAKKQIAHQSVEAA